MKAFNWKGQSYSIGDKVVFPRGMSYPTSRYVKEGDSGEIIEAGAYQYRVHLHKDGRVIWAPPQRIVLESEYIPIKKVQCLSCFHWLYPEKVSEGLCESCKEDPDESDYLWADWRQRCTL